MGTKETLKSRGHTPYHHTKKSFSERCGPKLPASTPPPRIKSPLMLGRSADHISAVNTSTYKMMTFPKILGFLVMLTFFATPSFSKAMIQVTDRRRLSASDCPCDGDCSGECCACFFCCPCYTVW